MFGTEICDESGDEAERQPGSGPVDECDCRYEERRKTCRCGRERRPDDGGLQQERGHQCGDSSSDPCGRHRPAVRWVCGPRAVRVPPTAPSDNTTPTRSSDVADTAGSTVATGVPSAPVR